MLTHRAPPIQGKYPIIRHAPKVINPGQTPTYIKLYINMDGSAGTLTKSAACAQKLADKPMESGTIHAN